MSGSTSPKLSGQCFAQMNQAASMDDLKHSGNFICWMNNNMGSNRLCSLVGLSDLPIIEWHNDNVKKFIPDWKEMILSWEKRHGRGIHSTRRSSRSFYMKNALSLYASDIVLRKELSSREPETKLGDLADRLRRSSLLHFLRNLLMGRAKIADHGQQKIKASVERSETSRTKRQEGVHLRWMTDTLV